MLLKIPWGLQIGKTAKLNLPAETVTTLWPTITNWPSGADTALLRADMGIAIGGVGFLSTIIAAPVVLFKYCFWSDR